MMYLGFVLSLTSTCYIGGLIIACTKRHKFKTYKMLRDEAKASGKEEESDEDD